LKGDDAMKARSILIVLLILAIGGGGGGYLYYDSVLTYTDNFTDCPIKAFRSTVTAPSAASQFATQQSYGSLENTEKCNKDCAHGNLTACAVYGLAVQYGVFVPKSDEEARDRYAAACEGGVDIGCGLSAYMDKIEADKKQAEAREAEKKAYAESVERVKAAKEEAALRKQQALDHFGGMGPMMSAAMVKYNSGNFHFLLYETPRLSQRHVFKGAEVPPEDLDLKAFLEAKYLNGTQGVKAEELLSLLDEFRTMGINQLRLDHFVENMEESKIPKNHKYYKAKYTFLYHLAEAEIPVLEEVEKKMTAMP
jgi:hypothetical protein